MEKRRTRRFPVRGSALLTAGRISSGATLLNLSEGGCALELTRLVQEKERFSLHLVTREEGSPLHIQEARVCWAVGARIGLEFLAMSDKTREQLGEYLRTQPGS